MHASLYVAALPCINSVFGFITNGPIDRTLSQSLKIYSAQHNLATTNGVAVFLLDSFLENLTSFITIFIAKSEMHL